MISEQNSPFFSILISNYNYAHFIEQAIDSCLSQTYHNYEIVIVDDGSTDRSFEICKHYGNKIYNFHHQENGGQGAAINAGLKLCRGTYICLLDADDIFLPTKLEVLAHELNACSELPDLIHHQIVRVNQNLFRYNSLPFPQSKFSGRVHHFTEKYGKRVIAPTSALTFKKKFLEKCLPLCPFKNRISADLTLKLLAYMTGTLHAVMKPLSMYRIHGYNNFCNYDQAMGNFKELSKNISDIELLYDDVNSKLYHLGIQTQLNPHQNIYFQGMQVVLGHFHKRQFLTNLIKSPIFDTFTDKLKFLKWVSQYSRPNSLFEHRESLR